LTAALLRSYRLTRPPFCRISTGGNKSCVKDIKGKRVCCTGRIGRLNHYWKWSTHCGYTPFYNSPRPKIAVRFKRPSDSTLTLNGKLRSPGFGSGALIPIPGRKCQLVILFHAFRTIVLIKPRIRVQRKKIV
jgi:hypothetical protein